MWKKDESEPMRTGAETGPRSESPRRSSASSERATIGRSITIRGEVSGDEDLLIQGQVDGSVDLELHAVTVGSEGRVKANVTARVITVEGEVEGDLMAQEQVILRNSASVKGDITAPRVVLEDGASFRGLVDMGVPPSKTPATAADSSKGKRANGAVASESVAEPEAGESKDAGSKDAGSTTSPTKAKSSPEKSGVGAVGEAAR